MAIVFLILAHLFASTATTPTFKGIILAVVFVGLLGDLLAPWLIRYVTASCSWIALVSWIAQGIGNAVLVGVSGWECLDPRPGAP